MSDLSHWHFTSSFHPKEAAALILGIDPASQSADLSKTTPVLTGMMQWFLPVRFHPYAAPPEERPRNLYSVQLLRAIEKGNAVQWGKSEEAKFEDQYFTEEELAKWLKANNFYSAYDFDRTIREKSLSAPRREVASALAWPRAVVDTPGDQKLRDGLDQLLLRFHAVCSQLRHRHDARATLDVADEYDVQDLFHALLRIYFNDVRPEEWVPSYAGSSSRTDFLLPQIDTVLEIEKTRPGLNARALGEQLIVDIAKYRKHPACQRLVCFVYDPDGRIANPAGLEADLNAGDLGLETQVLILPKLTS